LTPVSTSWKKLEKEIICSEYFTVVPTEESASPVERKVFLFVFEYMLPFQIKTFLEILKKAGWGGSVLIVTGNYPTVHLLMNTKQVDFVVQGRLGIWHDKDLFLEELCDRKDADEWRKKVLKCEFDDDGNVNYWQKQFLPEKLLKSQVVES
jgi:hypothetical protein